MTAATTKSQPARRAIDQQRRAHDLALPEDRASYSERRASEPTRNTMRQSYGYTCPTQTRARMPYSLDDKRDILALMGEGWWPLDIAVAYGVPIYDYRDRLTRKGHGRGRMSTIYKLVEKWTREERE